MKVEKPFWIREKGLLIEAFSYSDKNKAAIFAKKFGGEVIEFLEIDDDLEENDELYTLITSRVQVEPKELKNDARRFHLQVKLDSGYKTLKKYRYLKEANAAAKTISSMFRKVRVVKKLCKPSNT